MISRSPGGSSTHPLHFARVTIWNAPTDGARAGGDWSEAIAISDDTVALTVGDVSGHGARVARAMNAFRAAAADAIARSRVPSEILAHVNRVACAYGGDGLIATAIVALFDRRRLTLTFANAGHPPPLVLTADQHAFLAHVPADIPLGIFPAYHAADFVVTIPPDALVLLYTDGITEHARDPILGEGELIEAARAVFRRPDCNAARGVARRIFTTGRGTDDAAAIGVRTLSRVARRETAARADVDPGQETWRHAGLRER